MNDDDRSNGAPAGADAERMVNDCTAHPALHTGVIHCDADLRDEVETYWKAMEAWETTRQGPPPLPPSVCVRVEHKDEPSEAQLLREAMARTRAGVPVANDTAKADDEDGVPTPRRPFAEAVADAGTDAGAVASPWAAGAASAIERSALPSSHAPAIAALPRAEKQEAAAQTQRARRAGVGIAVVLVATAVIAIAIAGVAKTPPTGEPAGQGTGSPTAAPAEISATPTAGPDAPFQQTAPPPSSAPSATATPARPSPPVRAPSGAARPAQAPTVTTAAPPATSNAPAQPTAPAPAPSPPPFIEGKPEF